MFSNIGKKILVFSKAILLVGTIASIIVFIAGTSMYLENKDCLEYSSYLGDAGYGYDSLIEAGNNAYIGRMMMKYSIYAFIVSTIGVLPLYGFGVLIVSNEEIVSQNNTIIRLLEKQLQNGNSDRN